MHCYAERNDKMVNKNTKGDLGVAFFFGSCYWLNMTFKPYPWLTFFSILAFAALLTMGVWQVNRYEWKTQLNADIVAYAKTAPVPLTTLLADDPAQNFKYRPVSLKGQYLTDQQVLVRGQYKKSDRVILYGFYVFTPFQYQHAGVSRHLMVERGFITEDAQQKPATYNQLPAGLTTIFGNIKVAEKQGSFFPDNDPALEIWFWREITAMGSKFKLENVDNFYISASENQAQDFPKPTKIEIKSAVNHLSYLITWFALAAGLFILYIYMHIYNGRLYLNKNKNNETSK